MTDPTEPPAERLFPVFLDLAGRDVLLLGQGEAADRRRATLQACGARVRHATRFAPDLLDGCVLAIGAEAPAPDLAALHHEATRRGLPHNVVDRPALSSFITPATVERLPLQVAICSNGAAPVLGRLLRARIETLLAPAYGRLASLAARLKDETRARLPDTIRRRRMLERALDGPAAALMLAGDEAGAERAWRAELDAAERDLDRPPQGLVHLIDPGPGPADLLTLRALRLLGEADVIVHPPTGCEAALEVARRDASRLACPPADALAALLRLAREGRRVARLAPLPTEAAALAAHGIAVEIVPGAHEPGLTGTDPRVTGRAMPGPTPSPASSTAPDRPFLPVRIALLTVSDTRAPDTDRSGDTLAARLQGAGHALAARDLVADDADAIERHLRAWIADPDIDVVISTGGTGVTGRDVTPEAFERVIEKRIDGFGELFRMLSHAKIGTSTIQSRALAGVAAGTYLFALPGSPGAVADAWDDILVHQLDSRTRPCNLVELMPRLTETAPR